MTGILAKQLFLQLWVPERALNVQVRVHGLWLSKAAQPTSSTLCLVEGKETFTKYVHAWGPAVWTVVNSQPILPPASGLRWPHLICLIKIMVTHDLSILNDLAWTSKGEGKHDILFTMNKEVAGTVHDHLMNKYKNYYKQPSSFCSPVNYL